MTSERDTDRLLRQWLDEGPTRAADRLVETVEQRIDRQRQRPVWRLTWRDLFMNRTIGSFAAGAAVVAVALLGYNVLAGQGGDDGSAGAPAPSVPVAVTPSPSASPAPPSEAPPAGGGLTVSFGTPFPDGWDRENEITLINGGDAAVEVLEDRSVMSSYPDCVYGPAPGIGRTATDVANALATRVGLDVSGPEPTEVGGLSGQVLILAVADGFTDTCDWWENPGTPMVPTVGGFDEKNNWLFNGVVGDQRQRLYVLDKADGGNVVVMASASNAETWAANEEDIMSIIAGIQFETGS